MRNLLKRNIVNVFAKTLNMFSILIDMPLWILRQLERERENKGQQKIEYDMKLQSKDEELLELKDQLRKCEEQKEKLKSRLEELEKYKDKELQLQTMKNQLEDLNKR